MISTLLNSHPGLTVVSLQLCPALSYIIKRSTFIWLWGSPCTFLFLFIYRSGQEGFFGRANEYLLIYFTYPSPTPTPAIIHSLSKCLLSGAKCKVLARGYIIYLDERYQSFFESSFQRLVFCTLPLKNPHHCSYLISFAGLYLILLQEFSIKKRITVQQPPSHRQSRQFQKHIRNAEFTSQPKILLRSPSLYFFKIFN